MEEKWQQYWEDSNKNIADTNLEDKLKKYLKRLFNRINIKIKLNYLDSNSNHFEKYEIYRINFGINI